MRARGIKACLHRAWPQGMAFHYHQSKMKFPVKVCVVCAEEFELKPDKPGFANRCPDCSAPESAGPSGPEEKKTMDADERKSAKEANEARRAAMRNLLYRKDS